MMIMNSEVVPCRACSDIPTDREFHNKPLCKSCKVHLAENNMDAIPSEDRVNRYIDNQQKLRQRLQ